MGGLVIGREPGMVAEVLTLGATLHRLDVPAPDGRRQVMLNLPRERDRLASTDHLGATIGRCANRIAGGRFTLDGVEHRLPTNDRGNTLHGGPEGFDRREWTVLDHGADHVALLLVSSDGDQGFPGRVEAIARFEVDGQVLRTAYAGGTDAPTLLSMTSHPYLNLAGQRADGRWPTIAEHLLTVPAGHYLPVDDTGVPTGEVAPVDGTPFDLRRPQRLEDVLRDPHPQLRTAGGLDHHLAVAGAGTRLLATAEAAGLRAELRSDQPGLQVYTGNQLSGAAPGHPGRRQGLALEPQLPPDGIHHPEWRERPEWLEWPEWPERAERAVRWPSPVLRPGEAYSWSSELAVASAVASAVD